jgi:hypothetical protein
MTFDNFEGIKSIKEICEEFAKNAHLELDLDLNQL